MKLTIRELAEQTGVTRRTLRYYIAKGVLMRPLGVGKQAHYTREHLDRVSQIRDLQLEGHTLDEIRYQLDGVEVEPVGGKDKHPWKHLPVPDDMLVLIRMDIPEERTRQLTEAVAKMVADLEKEEQA